MPVINRLQKREFTENDMLIVYATWWVCCTMYDMKKSYMIDRKEIESKEDYNSERNTRSMLNFVWHGMSNVVWPINMVGRYFDFKYNDWR